MARDLIQVHRGTFANLPNLSQGEFGYTTDTEDLYIGGTSGNVKIGRESLVNAKTFGAKGDNLADDTVALQNAINHVNTNGGILYVPLGTYKISSALSIPNGLHMFGDIETKFLTTVNTINAFEFVSGVSKVNIHDFAIESSAGIGTDNTAFKFNDTDGGNENTIRNINILSFKYGIKTKELWWNNLIENVKINFCDFSIFNDSVGGQAINNLFVKCYSNLHKVTGVQIGSMKNTKFLSLNMGGDPATTNTFVSITLGNRIEFDSCNFEGGNFGDNLGGILVYGSSRVTIKNCTFASNENASGTGTSYEVQSRDTSLVKVESCSTITQGVGMSGLNAINDSNLRYSNNNGLTVTSSSSIRPRDLDKTIRANGNASVAGGGQLDTGLGFSPDTIILDVKRTDDIRVQVMVSVVEDYGNGIFKLRFANLLDGTENFSTHNVQWVAI